MWTVGAGGHVQWPVGHVITRRGALTHASLVTVRGRAREVQRRMALFLRPSFSLDASRERTSAGGARGLLAPAVLFAPPPSLSAALEDFYFRAGSSSTSSPSSGGRSVSSPTNSAWSCSR